MSGYREVSKEEFDRLRAQYDAEKSARAADMPTERDAIDALWRAHMRLRELGWKEIAYCPKDGTRFAAIEAGSTGIHSCHYNGEWPKGYWLIDGEWPSRPVLFRAWTAEDAEPA